jgi:group I intron endonuclease
MVVYIVRNTVNAKVYVGCTTRTIRKRWNGHKSNARLSTGTSLLHRAIRKHGVDKFSIDIVEVCQSVDEMYMREAHWVKALGTRSPNGYNLTDGGEGSNGHTGRPMSEEHKAKLRAINTGRPRPAHVVEAIRRASLGREVSTETRAKLSASHIGKTRTTGSIAKQVSTNTGSKRSPETIAKMREAQKTRKPVSDEARARMSASARRRCGGPPNAE